MKLEVVDDVHPLCRQLRQIRQSAGLSLVEAEQRVGVPAIVLGSWERGERNPPLGKLERVLNAYGYTLMAVQKDFDAVRLSGTIIRELRAIADQLENREKVR